MNRQPLVIIHGLRGNRFAFRQMMKYMKKEYDCLFFHYPMKKTVPEVVADFKQFVTHLPKFDCITHSFGSIIIRNFAAKHGSDKIGRVVMGMPPNKGSELLRKVMHIDTGRKLFDRLALDFIQHEKQYLPNEPQLKAGVIAGTKPIISQSKAISKFVSRIFDTTDSDGKVKVDETRLPYKHDFVMIEESHDASLRNQKFFKLARHYLKTGSFSRSNTV